MVRKRLFLAEIGLGRVSLSAVFVPRQPGADGVATARGGDGYADPQADEGGEQHELRVGVGQRWGNGRQHVFLQRSSSILK
jgi:hypothetical protein